ncbi:hypothetical protein BDZ91DRAFT_785633 [Kalaharituber pfeilii]|nr:hypothetical protein BDZ91DRAFT_785633 [Kalaharituber pfeilii]
MGGTSSGKSTFIQTASGHKAVGLVDQRKRREETEVGSYINDKLDERQKLLQQEIEDLERKYQRIRDRNGGSSGMPSEIEQLLDEKVKGLAGIRKKAEILGRDTNELVHEEVNNMTGRTSGMHVGLYNVMLMGVRSVRY